MCFCLARVIIMGTSNYLIRAKKHIHKKEFMVTVGGKTCFKLKHTISKFY